MSARDEAAGGVWQSIETAPKGEEVLIGVFRDDFEDPIIQNSILLDGEDKGMYWSDWHGMPEPTHWMRFSRPGQSPPSPRDQASSAMLGALEGLVNAPALSEVEGIVAGWNGPDKDNPNPRHPSRLGATIRTNCGRMYDLAEALAAGRAVLARSAGIEPGEGG